MFRSRSLSRAWSARVLGGALAALSAAACGTVAEWEPRAGELTLQVSPYPPVAGQPLLLGVSAKNVGPVRVYQGDELIAAFANVELDGERTYQVLASSSEIPRAQAVAYDYRELSIEARSFASPPPEPPAEPEPMGPPVEDCQGVREATGSCSTPGAQGVQLSVYNGTSSTVSVYDRRRLDGTPDSCFNDIKAIVPPGESRRTDQLQGNVIWFIDDATATVVRAVELPRVSSCLIVL